MHRFTRYEQLTKNHYGRLLRIHGVGKKAIETLREELAARGLSFADEDPS